MVSTTPQGHDKIIKSVIAQWSYLQGQQPDNKLEKKITRMVQLHTNSKAKQAWFTHGAIHYF
jgi:hypothetical protein